METSFAAGERRWRASLGTLREAVRQELVTRQLAVSLPAASGLRVLDVGCGQGTQLLRLARQGHHLTGLDASATLLADLGRSLAAEPAPVRERTRVVNADAHEVATRFAAERFDAVLCHGVLMYLADPKPLLRQLAAVLAPGGTLSLLTRNGDALAMRPGLHGDWDQTLAAFDTSAYQNRIGVALRADRVDELTATLAELGLRVRTFYGVRVFTDTAANDAVVPDERTFAALLACEERAGASDPYRRVAALVHLVADLV